MKHIVVIENGCWLWQVNINRNGYGRNYVKSKRYMAHITIYKLLKGEYPEGMLLDHVYCDHRNCCNPTHLSPVTVQHNTHRGRAILHKKLPRFKIPPDDDELEQLLEEYCYVN